MLIKKNDQGFTLVELVVVMAILAVLAGLVVPKFTGILADARAQANEANLQMLQTAVELYNAIEDEELTGLAELENKNYIDKVPEPPSDDYGKYVLQDGKVINEEAQGGG
ncbi:MAG: competence type IV pilus major pilin ComGC [Syntrophomonadaceae bacterium]|jgi:prepilin-type N-terminal cleavage/methylation domain-containing protein